jgi:hypothetical protein
MRLQPGAVLDGERELLADAAEVEVRNRSASLRGRGTAVQSRRSR